MTVTIAYAGTSAPSVTRIAEALLAQGEECQTYRDSTTPVLINWGRAIASAQLNANTAAVTNKREMREAFHAARVPMPILYSLSNAQNGNISFPAVGRPDKHTRARGFWLVNDEAEMRAAIQGKRYRNGTRKAAATHFMEYVNKERAPYEYRAHVFMGRIIRLSLKDFANAEPGQHYLTVSSQGRNTDHVRDAAIRALSAVGMQFGAVDILASESECWVLEVNSAPGLGGTMPALYAKVFAKYAREARQ